MISKIKVDRVKNVMEISRLYDLGIRHMTFSFGDSLMDDRSFCDLSTLESKSVFPNLKVGVKFTPNDISVREWASKLSLKEIDFVQVDYSQLERVSEIKYYIAGLPLVVDSIIADSDTDPSWLAQQINKCKLFGSNEIVLDIYSDRIDSLGDLFAAEYEDELTISEIKEALLGIKSFGTANYKNNEHYIKYLYPIMPNIKLSSVGEFGNYQSFEECVQIIENLTKLSS